LALLVGKGEITREKQYQPDASKPPPYIGEVILRLQQTIKVRTIKGKGFSTLPPSVSLHLFILASIHWLTFS
jgi:hypothetical protein